MMKWLIPISIVFVVITLFAFFYDMTTYRKYMNDELVKVCPDGTWIKEDRRLGRFYAQRRRSQNGPDAYLPVLVDLNTVCG